MINCEVFFTDTGLGTFEDAQLDAKTGWVILENIDHSCLTSTKKFIEFTYEGQLFKIDVCIRDGKLKVKNKKDISAIHLHMSLEESLEDTTKITKKMKI